MPIFRLGRNSDIGDDVILKTDVRRLHTAGFGPIGSGKSVAIAKPTIVQDARNVTVYLREYAKIYPGAGSADCSFGLFPTNKLC